MKFFSYILHQTSLFVEYVWNVFIEIGCKNLDKHIAKFNEETIKKSIVNESPKPTSPKPRGRPKKNIEFKVKVLKDDNWVDEDLIDFLKKYRK